MSEVKACKLCGTKPDRYDGLCLDCLYFTRYFESLKNSTPDVLVEYISSQLEQVKRAAEASPG